MPMNPHCGEDINHQYSKPEFESDLEIQKKDFETSIITVFTSADELKIAAPFSA